MKISIGRDWSEAGEQFFIPEEIAESEKCIDYVLENLKNRNERFDEILEEYPKLGISSEQILMFKSSGRRIKVHPRYC